MSNSNIDFASIIKDWNGNQKYRDLTWSGTFNDYLALVKENPKITRNAFQRMFDMVVEKGTDEYTEFKKQIIR